ncbi:hypothetical protein EP331_01225 [bacterium]|nr:MAG: hypothetical protein EP331_01225 [bacterium]
MSSGHHALSFKVLISTAIALAVLTVITVAVRSIHIPSPFNIIVAISIAVVKAYLVVMYFMNLRNDSRFNLLSFVFSVLFLLILVGLTMLDTMFRVPIVPGF